MFRVRHVETRRCFAVDVNVDFTAGRSIRDRNYDMQPVARRRNSSPLPLNRADNEVHRVRGEIDSGGRSQGIFAGQGQGRPGEIRGMQPNG